MIPSPVDRMVRELKERADHLRFFDSNIWLGKPQGFPLAAELNADGMKDALKDRFITGGLVSHWRGKVVSAQEGNEALRLALNSLSPAPQGNLFALWTGLPLYPAETGPIPGGGELPSSVRGIRIFPKSHNFPLAEWSVGSLCEWLTRKNMPMFIWHTELDWNSLHRLAGAFPDLRIVVETQPQKILYHTRPLFALMRDRRNVLLEISSFAGAGFLEWAVKEFGAERLIFGSFLPVSDPLVPMGMVLYADISERDKVLIAGENLRSIVEGVRP